MAFGWSKTRYSPIAIDFGVDSLKVLQVVLTDPPQLVAAAAVEIPQEARTDPSVRIPFLEESLRSIIKKNPFKGNKAVCSISAFQTLIQHLQIAKIEHEDFDTQVAIHLRQRLNIDPSRMVIRNFPVAQIVKDGSAKEEVIVMAASKESVMRHVEVAHRAKLDVVGMQCEPLAILQAFAHLFNSTSEETTTLCFLDLGAATTKVVVAHGPVMVFAKTLHVGGDHFIQQLAKERNIGFAEARQLRIDSTRQGAAAPQAELVAAGVTENRPVSSGAATGGMAAMEARIAAEQRAAAAPATASTAADTLDCLIDELQLCVRHHQSLFPGRPIQKLVFVGGESRHVNVCQAIARTLRIGAQLGDPLARLVRVTQAKSPAGVDLSQPQPGWAVPMGLCLSESTL